MRSAASILMTLPGTPFIYYGEELGTRNGPAADGDPSKREPMPWDGSPTGGFSTEMPWRPLPPGFADRNVAALLDDRRSLLHHYRSLAHLRAGHVPLSRGDLALLHGSEDASPILAFVRSTDTERLLVVHNLGAAPITAGPFALGRGVSALWSTPGASAETGPEGILVSLTGGASGVWRVE